MRKAVWKAMLDADMNVRYLIYMTQRLVRRDRCVKVFLAISSSGAVAGWTIWEQMPAVWKILSAISAVIAIVSPLLSYQKKIEELADLRGRWWELLREYEVYWGRWENKSRFEALEEDFIKTKAKEDDLVRRETNLPYDEKLLIKCQQLVLKARGITQ